MSLIENYNQELYHYGVKGMKWGVRKKRPESDIDYSGRVIFTSKSKNGTKLIINKEPTPALARFITKLSPRAQEQVKRSDICKIQVNGKNVGDLQLYKESKDSINVVWVSVNKKNEGQGYGTAVMKGVVNYARQNGLKHVTLEVPTTSPNARHIYEKIGFKSTGEFLGDENDIWGGLTKMRLDL